MVIVLDNLRSCHNVGSILRTADGFGCQDVIFIGTTPYPQLADDQRLPHAAQRQTKMIAKTALGAEATINGQCFSNAQSWLATVDSGLIVSLEQTPDSQSLFDYLPKTKVDYLVVGSEINGIDSLILKNSHQKIKIPMSGRKESFNVAVAAGIALYHLNYLKKISKNIIPVKTN